MSYILDALRKADAQRERDPARGIHAQSATALPPDRDADQASRLGWLGAGMAGAVLLALALWWLARPDSLVEAPRFSPGEALPFSSAVTSSPAVVAAPTPDVTPPAVTMPPPATEVQPAAPPMRALPPVTPADLPPVPALSPLGEAQKASPTLPAAAQPAVATGERLLSIAELPADVQRDLPRLTITGGVYSTNPAHRLLIVNGQVLNEGAEAAPGVVLTQIRPKTAVLSFRGWRYGVAY